MHGYAEAARKPSEPFSSIGAVVGATQQAVLDDMRDRMPTTIFLLPGVGAQGADIASLRPVFDSKGRGGLVPISRGLLAAHHTNTSTSWHDAVGQACRAYSNAFRELLATS